MKERKNITEIDFTDQIKRLEADEDAGYPPNCNEGYEEKDGKCAKKESEASEEKKECDQENCGNCDCEEQPEEAKAEEVKAEEEMTEVEEHDVNCPSCGCSLGRMWMKSGVMSRPAYASKYTDLYNKVKAADPQHDPEKIPEIKTTFESKRKIEDHPNAVLLRDVDEPIGFKESKIKEN